MQIYHHSKSTLLYIFHLFLFVLTGFTTTLAGVQWLNKDPLDLGNFHLGLPYSLSLLTILAAHEFGHFFAAKYHRVLVTLPYFIPVPPFIINPFGTMGAVIRLRSPLSNKKALFDIGIAGPLAGLIVTLTVLFYGFYTLPDINYLYTIHPEYQHLDQIPTEGLKFGNSILFWLFSILFGNNAFFPPMNEIYHYPYLCVGWFGLFITALNLIPVGQLDGGHIMYALVGKKQGTVARIFLGSLIIIGVSGFFPLPGLGMQPGAIGWLLWAAIMLFIIKLDHPEITEPVQLDTERKFLGWFAFLIFILSFPPIPFVDLLPP